MAGDLLTDYTRCLWLATMAGVYGRWLHTVSMAGDYGRWLHTV